MPPSTRYAQSGGVNIAYQVVGDGPVDLVYVPGWVSHVELAWDLPDLAAGFERLASFSRLILFDKRGTGMSDPVPASEPATLEQRMDDVRAVMDAVGSERAVIFGASEGGNMSMLFAATYPERTVALCTFGSFAKRIWSPDYPWAPTPEERAKTFEVAERQWTTGLDWEDVAPSLGPPALAELSRYYRRCASPGAAVALLKMNTNVDVRDVLPSIRVPTVVMHRTDDRDVLVEEGRYIASHIPDARFVEFPGADFLATFDGPARAIRCAASIRDSVQELGIELRAGLHTGECELLGDKVAGIAVHTGARIASLAGPGDVLVSATVRDLVSGSGIEFEDRGEHPLKGVGERRIYAVSSA